MFWCLAFAESIYSRDHLSSCAKTSSRKEQALNLGIRGRKKVITIVLSGHRIGKSGKKSSTIFRNEVNVSTFEQ